MTREEAIKVLQRMKYPYKCNKRKMIISNVDRDNEALDMAISALSQEPICDRDCEHCTWTECPIEPCDAISREDAEQMFRNIRSHLKPQDYKSAEEFNTRDLMLLNAEQMIHALPSVTQKSGKGSDKE